MSKLFQTLLISLLLFSSSCSEEKIDVAPMVTDLILETYIQNRLESTKSRPYNGIFVLSENGNIVHSKTQGFKDFRAKEKIVS